MFYYLVVTFNRAFLYHAQNRQKTQAVYNCWRGKLIEIQCCCLTVLGKALTIFVEIGQNYPIVTTDFLTTALTRGDVVICGDRSKGDGFPIQPCTH